ncbi:MAG TPA: 3-oxoacyl-[acyl-carrier-protein] reductase [Longimicrobiales bacterium]
MAELSGQIALVTGGSRGIGRSICERLARDGARVAVVARDAERAQATARALDGEGHKGYACDVADSTAVDGLVKQVEQDMGGLDILVNNAGVTADNLLVRIDDASWQKVIDTNLKGAFNLTRAAARGMMRRRKGRIINISSVVGLTGNPGQANYAASKAGLIGMTKAVAKELASRNVLVNAVAPGFIETEMTAELSEAARTALLGQIALGKLGAPDDVAGVVRFLSGADAAYITGQVLVVDGGMVM